MAMLITKPLMRWLGRLSYPRLFMLAGTLFGITLLLPDPVPFVDEILFGVVTLLLAGLKNRHGSQTPGEAAPPPIEGQARRR